MAGEEAVVQVALQAGETAAQVEAQKEEIAEVKEQQEQQDVDYLWKRIGEMETKVESLEVLVAKIVKAEATETHVDEQGQEIKIEDQPRPEVVEAAAETTVIEQPAETQTETAPKKKRGAGIFGLI